MIGIVLLVQVYGECYSIKKVLTACWFLEGSCRLKINSEKELKSTWVSVSVNKCCLIM